MGQVQLIKLHQVCHPKRSAGCVEILFLDLEIPDQKTANIRRHLARYSQLRDASKSPARQALLDSLDQVFGFIEADFQIGIPHHPEWVAGYRLLSAKQLRQI